MIKGGAYQSSDGTLYNVFELEEKGYYRFDIVRKGGNFHTDPDAVVFSMYKKRKTYMIGDRELYNEILRLKDTLLFAKMESETLPEWKDGRFFLKQIRAKDEKFFMSKTMTNGKFFEETYILDNQFLTLGVYLESDFNMDPINSSEYEAVEIDQGITKVSSPYVPLSVLSSKFNLTWINDRLYRVVKTVEFAREILHKCIESNVMVGFDYETDGVDFNLYKSDNIVGVVLSPERKHSYYLPFGHKKFENLPYEFMKEIEEAMQIIHENSEHLDDDSYVGKPFKPGATAHNKKFENKVSKSKGFNIPIRHDSFILSMIINPKQGRGIHALKTLEYERSGLKFLEFEDIFLDKNSINFADLDEELTRVYACPDADNTCEVWDWLWSKLPPYQRAIYELEVDLCDIKAEQEYWGFRIDVEKFIEGYKVTKGVLDLLIELIQALTRSEANIGSSQVLEDLLYNKMKAPVFLRTKKGRASTSSKALKKLATINREKPLEVVRTDIRDSKGSVIIKKDKLNAAKYPVVILLDKYREVNKLITAFYNRIIKGSNGRMYFDEKGELQGHQTRYFSWINQNGAESGRQSSPMHQLPKPIKATVLADSEDHNIAGSDYAQIELRLIFSLAGEQVLVDLCQDPDNDIHRAIACLIQGKEMWAISADDRQKDKARNFGVVYLISGMGLAAQKYGAGATKEQIKECEQSISDFYKYARRVAQFIKKNRAEVLREGKISTLFNRTRYFEQLFDPDLPKDKRESLIRQANNMPVQGLAADIMKRAEVNTEIYIQNKGWDKLVETPQGKFPLVRQMLSAHDELLVSYHKSIPVEEILKMKKECMEISIDGFAPLFVSTSIIDNWKEGKDDSYAIPTRLRDKLIEDYDRTGKSVVNETDSHKLTMLKVINEYRDNELIGYMEDLIKTHGDDPKVVANHVRHASLTHELISRFKQTDEHEKENGKLGHIEHILYSVERYMEYRASSEFEFSTITTTNQESKKTEEDENTIAYFEDIVGLSKEIAEYDSEGNMVYIGDSDSVDEDEYSLMFEDEENFISYQTSGDKVYVWELFDCICIDTMSMEMSQIDELLAYLYQFHNPKGFFTLKVFFNGDLIDTKIKAERLDLEEVTDEIKRILSIEEEGVM